MEGVEVAAVGVDGAQQVQGIAVPLRLPQKPQGAGVLPVVEVEDQPVGKGGCLHQGAGAVQGQAGVVTPDHLHGAHELHRSGVDAREGVGENLHIQGVEHAAPGGIKDKGAGAGALLHAQQGQLVGHHACDLVQLLLSDGLVVLGVDLVPEQTHGVAVGQLLVGPGGDGGGLGDIGG